MFIASINGGPTKPLEASFNSPKFSGRMGQQRGYIGRMPYTMGAEMAVTQIDDFTLNDKVRLLCHFDGTNGSQVFTDSAGFHHLIANAASPVLSTSSPKFGTASLLSTAAGEFAFDFASLAGDILYPYWTIEAWVKPDSATTDHSWMCYLYGSSSLPAVSMAVSGNVVLGDAAGNQIASLSQGAFSAGVWSHRAIVRNGATVKTYANGIEQDSVTIGTTALYDGSVAKGIIIGGSPSNGAAYFFGYIDELRIINGLAVYTSNFTPPVAPFQNP